jgi:hypothetical protein
VFEAPIDSLYVWTGLSLTSALFLGVAVGLPTQPPPNAASVADAVDVVAGSPYPSTAEQPTGADAARIGPRRVTLRGDGGTSHATFVSGPVVPAGEGSLGRVLSGIPPRSAFDTLSAFREAVTQARTDPATWRPVEGEIAIRKVSWGEFDVTLVGS